MITHKPAVKNILQALLLSGLLTIALFASLYRNVDAAVLPAAVETTPVPVCHFGVNVLGDVTQFDTGALRMGWYVNYSANAAPAEPHGADYAPIISLSQIGDSYAYTPGGTQLNDAILGNLGAVWFIGNEPDRRDVQDDIEPHLYAEAYHELYSLIKMADPTARIFAGTIVQPTPLRLQYLDMVLSHYQATYGQPMPVDGWAVHNFILNEVSCEYDDTNCWGAGIPPGIDAGFGEVLTVEDNDNLALFQERIVRFRQWMAANGYRNKPLYVSEYGILMPVDLGFTVSRVNAFMNNTFDYMLTAADPHIGYPNDENRLVQKWSWFSTGDANFNGDLFNLLNNSLTLMGQNFAAYTAVLPNDVDLYPAQIYADPVAPFSQGGAVTFALNVVVANSGNLISGTVPVTANVYNGDPNDGGVLIASSSIPSLTGCGDFYHFEFEWADVLPGAYEIFVEVSPATGETDTQNNLSSQVILVATERVFLPVIAR